MGRIENLKKAQELERQAKELRRAERKFWQEVDANKSDILKHWGINPDASQMSDTDLSFYPDDDFSLD